WDSFAEQFDREILRFDQIGVATLAALRADPRPQPLQAVGGFAIGLRDELLRRQALPHSVAEQQITREVQASNTRNEWCDAVTCGRHRAVSFGWQRSALVSIEGRETQSALLPALRRPAVGRAN